MKSEDISKKFIVITSIFDPTETVRRFAQLKDWVTIVVGDKKTPKNWNYNNVIYLSPEKQNNFTYKINKYLPWNHQARVMMGYLYAIEHGAEIITQIDDDNIPGVEWNIDEFDGTYQTIDGNGFVNIYKYFTDKPVWPRGYPLNRILEKNKPKEIERNVRVGVWQHLSDKETDVDAIYRLTNSSQIFFKKREPVVLSPGTICPFNCQSTTFRKEVFPLLYLPVSVTPRESDIVRGLVAQPILWSKNYTLGFTESKVVQERNPHDYLKDFTDELLIYKYSEVIAKEAANSVLPRQNLNDSLISAYEALVKRGIIQKKELNLLKAWIEDLVSLSYESN